jgi:hypothetical protein
MKRLLVLGAVALICAIAACGGGDDSATPAKLTIVGAGS